MKTHILRVSETLRGRVAVLGVDRRKMMVFLISHHQEPGIERSDHALLGHWCF